MAPSNFDRTINISVKSTEMGLFDFKVSPSTFKKVNDRSNKTVKDFFTNAEAIKRRRGELNHLMSVIAQQEVFRLIG